jgi:hypothetical protein
MSQIARTDTADPVPGVNAEMNRAEEKRRRIIESVERRLSGLPSEHPTANTESSTGRDTSTATKRGKSHRFQGFYR